MSNRTKLSLNILAAALLLGVLGDALLRQTPWGVNVFLWTGALVAAMYALHGRWGRAELLRPATEGGWLVLPVLFFAAAFAWRASATLKLLDGLAIFVALALLAWRARGRSIRLASLGEYALGLGDAAFNALFASLPLVLTDVQWATIPRNGVMRHVWAVARGVVIAVPLLFLFGALFMAADAVFEGIMRQTFQLDGGETFSHFFVMLLFTWLVGGFLRGMMLRKDAAGEILHAAVPAAAAAAPPATTPYTSITVDDKGQSGGTDATRENAPGAHRQPPASVVVEGGATAAAAAATEGDGDDSTSHRTSGSVDAGPHNLNEARGETGGVGGATAATATTAAQAATNRAQAARAAATAAERKFSLGAVEVGVVLGLLNVLFACFVVVQFRYFFGGAARVMSITELTYAEYARRGFFELTWVAGLVLPLLLITHALLQRRERPGAAERIFRPLAGTQVALLFVIMASAVARMRLYQSEYGLTELRLYTTAFMLWLGLVFVWFAWTVLVRSNRRRFACGALVAAFVTVGLLHLLNPDAYIVRANDAHARTGRAFDAVYATSLSADAVPALISAMPSLSRAERCVVARELSARWSRPAPGEDWRGWSLARSRAWRAVAAHQEELNEATCPPPSSVSGATLTGAAATTNATTTTTTTASPVTTTTSTGASTTNGNITTNASASAATTNTTNATTSPTANASSAATRAKSAPRTANRKAAQPNRTRGAKRAKAR